MTHKASRCVLPNSRQVLLDYLRQNKLHGIHEDFKNPLSLLGSGFSFVLNWFGLGPSTMETGMHKLQRQNPGFQQNETRTTQRNVLNPLSGLRFPASRPVHSCLFHLTSWVVAVNQLFIVIGV